MDLLAVYLIGIMLLGTFVLFSNPIFDFFESVLRRFKK